MARSDGFDPIGEGSGEKGRNVMNGAAAGASAYAVDTVIMLALRLGEISNETTSLSRRPTKIRANASTRDTQSQHEVSETSNAAATASSFSANKTLSTPRCFLPRPLPEEMVVGNDVSNSDADDTSFVTPGIALQSGKDSIV